MKDYLSLGCTPCDESCVQVGEENYMARSRKETRIYIQQLQRMNPTLPDGVYFTIKTFPHDFGSYIEACVIYDDDKEDEVAAVFKIEETLPTNWDAEAKAALAEAFNS